MDATSKDEEQEIDATDEGEEAEIEAVTKAETESHGRGEQEIDATGEEEGRATRATGHEGDITEGENKGDIGRAQRTGDGVEGKLLATGERGVPGLPGEKERRTQGDKTGTKSEE